MLILRVFHFVNNRHILRLSLIFILLSFFYSMLYCYFYVRHFVNVDHGFTHYLFWAIRKYAIWWVLCPALLYTYSQYWKTKKHLVWVSYLSSIIIATIYSAVLDYLSFDPDVQIGANLIIFLPNHMGSATLILLGWFWILMPKINMPDIREHPNLKKSDDIEHDNLTGSLKLITGTKEINIPINQVESVCASGNYMEVDDGQNTYLMRATMKDLETYLKPFGFVRIHRSYLINENAILSLTSHSSVTLRSGQTFPISQRYKRQFINSTNKPYNQLTH